MGFREKLAATSGAAPAAPAAEQAIVRYNADVPANLGTRASEGAGDSAEQIAAKICQGIRSNRNSDADELLKPEKVQDLERYVRDCCAAVDPTMSSPKKSSIIRIVKDELTGAGPLEPLIKDPTVMEIMINGPKHVYVEKDGEINITDVTFRDEAHLRALIEKWISMVGRRWDEIDCDVDARMPQGYRIHVMGAPVALNGPHITIRKFRDNPLTAQDLVNYNTVTAEGMEFLQWVVRNKKNVVVSGGTSSGKTSNLNVLSDSIPPHERILVVEDSHELKLKCPHTLYWETRPANVEGRGRKSMQDLVRNALRARPDRIVVGEVRSSEALDLVQAMNTGHDGILTTVHANSCEDALRRIELLVMQGGLNDLPVWALREYIATGIHIVVQAARIGRYSKRKIVEIAEVLGVDRENRYQVNTLFMLQDKEGDGFLEPTGNKPTFYDRLDSTMREMFDKAAC